MKNQNRIVTSGEIYFVEGIAKELSNCDHDFWTDRPAVVVSSDQYNESGSEVFVTFMTRHAHDTNWYKKFSPQQIDIDFDGGATVLCSRMYQVEKTSLGSYMGKVKQNELQKITAMTKMSQYFDDCHLKYLCQPENGFESASLSA